MEDFLRKLFSNLDSREPPYDDDLNWIQFLYTGDTQGGYRDLTNMYFSFVLPMEREDLFLPDLECPRTLYPRAYTWGATSMTPLGPEGGEL